jgi:hypothetical protein
MTADAAVEIMPECVLLNSDLKGFRPCGLVSLMLLKIIKCKKECKAAGSRLAECI